MLNSQLGHRCGLCSAFLAYDEYEVSPYEELKLNLVRNIEMSRMASIMSGREERFCDFAPKIRFRCHF